MRPNSLTCLTMASLLAAVATLVCLSPASSRGQAATPTKSTGLQAITKPSMEVPISFVRPGRVVEVLVDVGDTVKVGQLLARQDNAEELAALAIDESKATDETAIHAQEAARDQKAKDVEKMKASPGGVGQFELEAAILEAKLEVARVAMANMQHKQDQLRFAQSSLAVEKLRIVSQMDGIVAQRLMDPGASADGGNMTVLRIVQLDPLRVEVAVPILQARKLAKGAAADVTFSDNIVRPGKVAIVYPVGDAASETIIVRVEVPNKDKLQSGEKVFVNFPSTSAAVAKP